MELDKPVTEGKRRSCTAKEADQLRSELGLSVTARSPAWQLTRQKNQVVLLQRERVTGLESWTVAAS